MSSVLLALNEKSILTVISYYLERAGFIVNSCSSTSEILTSIERLEPKVIILDDTLPGNASIKEICFNLKNKPRTKSISIILASNVEQTNNQVIDDFILKPFVPSELMLKIKKYINLIKDANGKLSNKSINYNGIEMHVQSFKVIRNGRLVRLGPTEFKILQCFIELPGKVLSREHIMNHVWGYNSNVEPRTVDVHINRLRIALKEPNEDNSIIRTIRSAGYSLNISADNLVRI